MARDPGNNLSSAQNLGNLNAPIVFKNSIGGKDKADILKFNLTGADRFNVSTALKQLKADANFALLDSNGKVLFQSKKSRKQGGPVNNLLDAGTYYVRVKGSKKATPFKLSLAATAVTSPTDPNGTFNTATDLGVLSNVTRQNAIGGTESFGRDENDFYRFSLDGIKNVTASLSNLSGDANLEIYNSNFQRIGSGTLPGSASETIDLTGLAAGTYYARVIPGSSTASTNYTLSLNATNPPTKGNTPPTLTVADATIGRNAEIVIGGDRLKATDTEQQNPGQLLYTVNSLPENGTLTSNGQQVAVGGVFSQADVNSGGLKYKSLPKDIEIGSGNLVDVLEVDGSRVFFTERDAAGVATLKYKDLITGKEEVLSTNIDFNAVIPPGGVSPVVQLQNGGIDGSTIVWSQGGQLFFYNGETSSAPVNITSKLPAGFTGFNFFGIDDGNVIFTSTDNFGGVDSELFLFKGGTGQLERLTDDTDNEGNAIIDGNSIAWQSFGSAFLQDVFLYDMSKGTPLTNAVNLTANNLFGTADANATLEGLSGNNVIISASDTDLAGDRELFVSNGTATGIKRLTTNNFNDDFEAIDGNIAVWTTGGTDTISGSTTDLEIAVQDVTTNTPVLTQNDVNDFIESADDGKVVWSAQVGGQSRLFYRDGTGAAVEITKDQPGRPSSSETFLGMDGVNVVWQATDASGKDQLFFRNMSTNAIQKLTNISGGQILNFGEISDSNVLYSIGEGIFLADGNAGSSIAVSPKGGNFTGFGQHDGFNVAWTSPASAGGEKAFFGNFAPKDGFNVTVSDGVGGSASGAFNVTIAG